jgi:hypothetical protein
MTDLNLFHYREDWLSLRFRLECRAYMHKAREEGNVEDYTKLLSSWFRRQDGGYYFTWILNDSPEDWRLTILQHLENDHKQEYETHINQLTELQTQRNDSLTDQHFQCVATNQYLKSLPKSAHECSKCYRSFQEGSDMIWRACENHAYCGKCWYEQASRSIRPMLKSCTCLLYQITCITDKIIYDY